MEILQRGTIVDFLIRLLHPSWHPESLSHSDRDSQVNLQSDHDESFSEVNDELRKMTMLNVAAQTFIPAAELKSERNENTSHDV